MQVTVKSISRYSLSLALVFIAASAGAEWKKIANGSSQEPEQYIDLDSVKQAGPMAIYRQVNVLSQVGALPTKGASSKLSLQEYDCMNSKFREVQATAYSEAWATGEKVVLESPTQNSKAWQDLPAQSLGRSVLNMVCPGAEQPDPSK